MELEKKFLPELRTQVFYYLSSLLEIYSKWKKLNENSVEIVSSLINDNLTSRNLQEQEGTKWGIFQFDIEVKTRIQAKLREKHLKNIQILQDFLKDLVNFF